MGLLEKAGKIQVQRFKETEYDDDAKHQQTKNAANAGIRDQQIEAQKIKIANKNPTSLIESPGDEKYEISGKYWKMNVIKLKNLLDEKGLKKSGSKSDLVERLTDDELGLI